MPNRQEEAIKIHWPSPMNNMNSHINHIQSTVCCRGLNFYWLTVFHSTSLISHFILFSSFSLLETVLGTKLLQYISWKEFPTWHHWLVFEVPQGSSELLNTQLLTSDLCTSLLAVMRTQAGFSWKTNSRKSEKNMVLCSNQFLQTDSGSWRMCSILWHKPVGLYLKSIQLWCRELRRRGETRWRHWATVLLTSWSWRPVIIV